MGSWLDEERDTSALWSNKLIFEAIMMSARNEGSKKACV